MNAKHYRIQVNGWYHHSNYTIWNGSLKKTVPFYTPIYSSDEALSVRNLVDKKGLEDRLTDLTQILLVAGTGTPFLALLSPATLPIPSFSPRCSGVDGGR